MPVQIPKKSEWMMEEMMDNSTIGMVFGDAEWNDQETKHVEH